MEAAFTRALRETAAIAWATIVLSLFCVSFAEPEIFPALSALYCYGGLALFWWAVSRISSMQKIHVLFPLLTVVYISKFSWLLCPQYHGFAIIVLCLILAAVYALSFAALTMLVVRASEMKTVYIATALWYFFEWSMSRFLCGFTVDQFGVHAGFHPAAAQLASYIGSLGISAIICITNGALFLSLKKKMAFALSLAILILPPAASVLLFMQKEGEIASGKKLTVALLQTALKPEEKRCIPANPLAFIPIEKQWREWLSLTKKIRTSGAVDIAVYPEAAIAYSAHAPLYALDDAKYFLYETLGVQAFPDARPFVVEKRGELYATNAFFFQVIAEYLNAAVVVGLTDERRDENFTSAFLFSPQRKIPEVYDKRILVPVAEGVPFPAFRSLAARYGISEFFTAGTEQKMLGGAVKILPSVCYEEMRADMLRNSDEIQKIFINVTNDAWYPSTTLPQRHYSQSKMRCIENGVPYARACNTGVSALFQANGREIARITGKNGETEWVKGWCSGEISLGASTTFYAKFGDLPTAFLLILSASLALFLRKDQYNS